MTNSLRRTAPVLALAALLAACGGEGGGTAAAVSLTGAGATFPNPIYTQWFNAYHQATGARINYQSIGSGGGIRQFTEGTVDFGATDGPMTEEQIAAVQGDVLHLPTVLGAVVLTYNLPGLSDTLTLDAETIAGIYMGQITRWNDPKLAGLNAGASLPDQQIIVVHRSDGSGTSYIFTDYLSKVSPEWKERYGAGTSINWPVGLGGKGNEGVTQQVKQTVGAIGYVELIYATSNGLSYAAVRNAAGNAVVPSLATVTAAAEQELGDSTDFRVSITDAPGAQAYPIASFTWLLVRRSGLADSTKQAGLEAFLGWMVGPEAQRMAADLGYAPLPMPVIERVQRELDAL
jgi:phosphate transport system substrate-binding protein